ncbi:MAG TPA: nucleoside phosphorylase [Firmicutes bacterium]|jgi:uridine phosphorylase|nr:nucleoside phosphorylase [Bacillota bacterium]
MADVFTQHHIKAKDQDVARYCFIPGDHVRGRKMAGKLDDMRLVADTRGYFVYTGLYREIPMTVCSTGMGGPQVAIAMEELGNMGADTFIRIGSAGGVAEHTGVGDIVIATGSYRGGGTADEYLDKAFPAVADFHITLALVQSAKDAGLETLTGPVATVDAFYAPEDLNKRLALREGGILCIEMEADAEFIIGLYRGFRCGAAFVLDNGPRTDKKVSVKSGESTDFAVAHHGKDPVYVESENRLIEIGFEAMYRISRSDLGE